MKRQRLAEAMVFAARAHQGQFRWEGQPYITHPMRVSEALADQVEGVQIVAVLHDVLEDCPWIEVVQKIDLVLLTDPNNDSGFFLTSEEYDALDAMTRRKDQGEEYPEYTRRLGTNRWATKIKIADVDDNIKTMKPESKTWYKHKAARDYLVTL